MNTSLTTARRCYNAPTPNNIAQYLEQMHPDILQEVHATYIPLKYPIELIPKIKDFVFVEFGMPDQYAKSELFSSRDIVLGVVLLLYSKYPIGKMRSYYLHGGAGLMTAKALNMQPPNVSKTLDDVASWFLSDGVYKQFRKACEKIAADFLAENT